MTRSDLFKTAHKMTKEDMKLYLNINYRVQFGLNLSALYSKKDMNEKLTAEKLEKMVMAKGKEIAMKNRNDERLQKLYDIIGKINFFKAGRLDRLENNEMADRLLNEHHKEFLAI